MMSAYWWLRLVHGYWRWMVLVSALVVLVRATVGAHTGSEWARGDERAMRGFLAAVDLQVMTGIILYFAFSPFWLATYQSFHETMSSPVARFFGVEHETAMLLALIAAHVGRARAERASAGSHKHRATRAAMLIFFALLLWAIPWPWRSFGRPLFRTTF
jgi:hypothetical protein